VTNNFSKSQEFDADRLAVETCVSCFGFTIEQQIQILESIKKDSADAGGFWDRHPSWNDRIENVKRMVH
jgi:predicted Zn-dependent protease